jgi:hypothetical protein
MVLEKKIVLELDERYFNQNDLRNAVVEYLENKGKSCEIIDNTTLLVDNQRYTLIEKNMSMGGVPLQQVILKATE